MVHNYITDQIVFEISWALSETRLKSTKNNVGNGKTTAYSKVNSDRRSSIRSPPSLSKKKEKEVKANGKQL